jgi:hypothetical protein
MTEEPKSTFEISWLFMTYMRRKKNEIISGRSNLKEKKKNKIYRNNNGLQVTGFA